MPGKLRTLLFVCLILLACQPLAKAQSAFEKIADDTFKFLKYGTFAKPSISKNSNLIALGQVRVHYKFITTELNQSKGTSGRITAYLESDVTESDLQKLTDEFYQSLARKLATLGINGVEWEKIQATDYYQKRLAETEEHKRKDGDVKSGQGWLTFRAKDGPVLLSWNPANGVPEIVGYGQSKEIRKFCEQAGADLATFDIVVDFAAIQVGVTSSGGTKYVLGGVKTTSYQGANFSVAPALMVNLSRVSFFNEKMKYDGYRNERPVITTEYFADKPYEDASKAALNTRRFFGTTFTATPVVIETKRTHYLAAARSALNLYADLLVEKLRQIRSKS